MKALKDRSIATRLRLGFALLIIMSMAVAAFGRSALQQVGAQMRELTEQHMVIVGILGRIKDNVSVTARAARNIALLSDPAARQAEKQRIDGNRAETQALLKQLEDKLAGGQCGAQLERVTRSRQDYVKQLNQAIQQGLEGQMEAARHALVGDIRVKQDAYFAALDELADAQR